MADIWDFFARLAKQLTDQLPADRGVEVLDGPQRADAIGWSSVSVHPMQVLETEYQSIVRAARPGDPATVADQRDAEMNALSRFFATFSGPLTPLDLPDSPIRRRLRETPVVADRIAGLKAQLRACERLLEQGSGAVAEVDYFVELAIGAYETVAPLRDQAHVAEPVWQALNTLRFTGTTTPREALADWKATTHANPAAALVERLKADVLRPLSSPRLSAASVKALYNIQEFYLFRLMHRFEARAGRRRVDLETKGNASGEATKLLHQLEWLTPWHERRIADLSARVVDLNDTLKEQFDREDDCVRFYLKGGRALFTALGEPRSGSNDWDTGILINPDLPPELWYTAFGAANDLVLLELDRYRFLFTAELHRHSATLLAERPVALAEVEDSAYTTAGHLAEHAAERLAFQAHERAVHHGLGRPRTTLALYDRDRPSVGVNGELIDIAISRRSSIELREHWQHVHPVARRGVSGVDLPVPGLGYIVDDFGTMLREALGSDQPPTDRKLAKRLVRLDKALAATDQLFTAELLERRRSLTESLPNATAALQQADDPVTRMKIWILSTLVRSVTAATPVAVLAALDDHVRTEADRLFAPTATDRIWNVLKADPSLEDPSVAARCRNILAVQGAAHSLAADVLTAMTDRQKLLTSHDERLHEVLETMCKVASHPQSAGFLRVTGASAAHRHAARAGLPPRLVARCWPLDCVELELGLAQRADHVLDRIVKQLLQLHSDSWTVTTEHDVAVIRPKSRWPVGGVLPDPDPPVIVISRTTLAPDLRRGADTIDGLPVAPLRTLITHYRTRAGEATDYLVRDRLRATATLLGEDILGRQI